MRWTVLNALGGLAWLAGIIYAKGAEGAALGSNDHHLVIGASIGIVGLAVLLWANLKTTA